ncbi:hypothetical protein [Arthrobacter cupressi]
MPFDATTHVDAIRVGTSPAAALPVIPCIDATSGTVLLFVAGRQELHRCAEPLLLTRALSRAVRPALWLPAERKLLLAVAARGYRAGKELSFILE